MGRRWWAAAFAIVGCASILSPARGAIMNASGTLHATASASSTSGSSSSNPPDQTFSPPATGSGIAASATVAGADPAFASVNAVVSAFGGISISGQTSINGAAIGSGNFASASATGTITFTETVAETLLASASSTDALHGGIGVTLKNSSNVTVLSLGTSQITPHPSQSVSLAPDTYTMTWGLGPQRATGTGGSSSVSFSLVPEPTGLGWLGLLAMLARRPRRRPRQSRT